MDKVLEPFYFKQRPIWHVGVIFISGSKWALLETHNGFSDVSSKISTKDNSMLDTAVRAVSKACCFNYKQQSVVRGLIRKFSRDKVYLKGSKLVYLVTVSDKIQETLLNRLEWDEMQLFLDLEPDVNYHSHLHSPKLRSVITHYVKQHKIYQYYQRSDQIITTLYWVVTRLLILFIIFYAVYQ